MTALINFFYLNIACLNFSVLFFCCATNYFSLYFCCISFYFLFYFNLFFSILVSQKEKFISFTCLRFQVHNFRNFIFLFNSFHGYPSTIRTLRQFSGREVHWRTLGKVKKKKQKLRNIKCWSMQSPPFSNFFFLFFESFHFTFFCEGWGRIVVWGGSFFCWSVLLTRLPFTGTKTV